MHSCPGVPEILFLLLDSIYMKYTNSKYTFAQTRLSFRCSKYQNFMLNTVVAYYARTRDISYAVDIWNVSTELFVMNEHFFYHINGQTTGNMNIIGFMRCWHAWHMRKVILLTHLCASWIFPSLSIGRVHFQI